MSYVTASVCLMVYVIVLGVHFANIQSCYCALLNNKMPSLLHQDNTEHIERHGGMLVECLRFLDAVFDSFGLGFRLTSLDVINISFELQN